MPALSPGSVRWEEIRLVSWDVDGTLYDSKRFRRLFIREVSTDARLSWRERWWVLRGMHRFQRQVEAQRRQPGSRVREADLAGFEPVLERALPYFKTLLPVIGARAEAVRWLNEIAGRKVKQVVLSDFEAAEKLEALGLTPRFEEAFACRALGFWKPSPLPFRHLQERFGVKPHEHLHVGDREECDGEGARLSGGQFVKL